MDQIRTLLGGDARKKQLQIALSIITLLYLSFYIYQQWNEVDVVSLSFSIPLVTSCAGALILFYLFFSRSWQRTIQFVEAKKSAFSWPELHRVFIFAFLTRYLPAGNVVTIGTRVGFFRSLGGSGTKGFESVYHEQIYLTLGAMTLGGAALLIAPDQALPALAVQFRWPLFALIIAGVLGLGLATDWALTIVSNVIPIDVLDRLGARLNLQEKIELLARFLLINILQGAAAFLGVWAIYPELPTNFQTILLVGAAYPLSRVVGQAAAIVPGGLGVREGAFAFLLGTYLPVQPLILGGALIRLLSVLVELANAALIVLWYRFRLGQDPWIGAERESEAESAGEVG